MLNSHYKRAAALAQWFGAVNAAGVRLTVSHYVPDRIAGGRFGGPEASNGGRVLWPWLSGKPHTRANSKEQEMSGGD